MRKSCGRLVTISAWMLASGCVLPTDDGSVAGLDEEGIASASQSLAGSFRLKAVHSGLCVDVSGGGSANGASIIQHGCHGGANQTFRVQDMGGGEHVLIATSSNKCLDVAGAGQANGAAVQQWACADVDQQRWTLESQGQGRYRLRAVHSGKCLDVTGRSTEPGARLQQWNCSSGENQRFALEAVDSDPGTPDNPGNPGGGASPIGSGWERYSPTRKIHLDDTDGLQTFSWSSSKSVCNPTCADYKYDSATDTETFRVIDNRSNRSEIRLQNDYASGTRQFQGFVTFGAPLDDESLFQVFGSTSGATQLMIRGFSSNGGSLRGGGRTLATGIYGVEQRINVVHRQGNDIRMYVNGSLAHSIEDDEAVSNYHKYGCYGTLRTGAATVKWRQVRHFKDGHL
jgi:hypothetical protein